jgi:hypothetical protein
MSLFEKTGYLKPIRLLLTVAYRPLFNFTRQRQNLSSATTLASTVAKFLTRSLTPQQIRPIGKKEHRKYAIDKIFGTPA